MTAEKNAVITSGRGEVIPMHPDFRVVGAGNTNMKTTSASFGGNNKQDYSLVDRFVGSIYKIDIDETTERSLIYS
jgi:cobaltochelatase CobS